MQGLEPSHPLARVRKARVYVSLGKLEEALTELSAHQIIKQQAWQKKCEQEGRQV